MKKLTLSLLIAASFQTSGLAAQTISASASVDNDSQLQTTMSAQGASANASNNTDVDATTDVEAAETANASEGDADVNSSTSAAGSSQSSADAGSSLNAGSLLASDTEGSDLNAAQMTQAGVTTVNQLTSEGGTTVASGIGLVTSASGDIAMQENDDIPGREEGMDPLNDEATDPEVAQDAGDNMIGAEDAAANLALSNITGATGEGMASLEDAGELVSAGSVQNALDSEALLEAQSMQSATEALESTVAGDIAAEEISTAVSGTVSSAVETTASQQVEDSVTGQVSEQIEGTVSGTVENTVTSSISGLIGQ